MTLLLIFGLILGIRHALEPDHLAAVLVLSAHSKPLSSTVKQGVMWGLGHTITLLLFSMIILGWKIHIDETIFMFIETMAGLIILFMGLEILIKTKIFSYGKYENKEKLMFNNSCNNSTFTLRAFCIGLVHGAAGSGVIIAFVSATMDSMYLIFTYIALFSIGLIITMSLFSFLLSVPIYRNIKSFPSEYLHFISGILAILIGLKLIYNFNI